MLPASRAAWVPVFIATPTSAWASAGASLVPSPAIATSRPSLCSSRISSSLRSGRGLGEEVVDARLVGDLRRGERVVAGDHHRADAHRAQLVEAGAHALLDDVLQVDDAEHLAVARNGERGAALAGDAVELDLELGRRLAALGRRRSRKMASPAPLRSRLPSRSTPLMRVSALKGTNVACAVAARARGGRTAWPAPRWSGPPASRRPAMRAGRPRPARPPDARHRDELGGLPVAEGDRASLVEQQHVHVARSLDRPTGHRQHVAAHEAVHAGDSDRRQQGADRRRDQRHQQRDQRDGRDVGAA